jgi:hypothetical protein
MNLYARSDPGGGPCQSATGNAVGQLDCIREFSEVDYTPDLKFDVAS